MLIYLIYLIGFQFALDTEQESFKVTILDSLLVQLIILTVWN